MTPTPAITGAVARLRAGGVVAFPTETVYGLGADASNPRAVARVFALKGRPANNPLIVHVGDAAMARPLAADWPDAAQRVADAFWPGPLTIVLPKSARVLPAVTGGGDTVALRSPDHPVALDLLRAFGGPLVGPSANPSGRVSPTTAEHVRAAFARDDVMVLDGGPCRGGIESTVLSLAGEPCILRPGLVTVAQIEAVLGYPATPSRSSLRDGVAGYPEPLPAPGQLATHYAPVAAASLFDAADWPRIIANERPVAILTHHERAAPPPHTVIRMPTDAAAYAARLYAALREADALSPALIAVERPPSGPPDAELWTAILDRLCRATSATPPNLLSGTSH